MFGHMRKEKRNKHNVWTKVFGQLHEVKREFSTNEFGQNYRDMEGHGQGSENLKYSSAHRGRKEPPMEI